MTTLHAPSQDHMYELRFDALRAQGRSFTFPCDADGRVDLDALSDQKRNAYFYARTVMGAEVRRPSVSCAA